MAEAKKDSAGVKLPIYMDNHATTRVDPRVLDAHRCPIFPTTLAMRPAATTSSDGWPSRRSSSLASRSPS